MAAVEGGRQGASYFKGAEIGDGILDLFIGEFTLERRHLSLAVGDGLDHVRGTRSDEWSRDQATRRGYLCRFGGPARPTAMNVSVRFLTFGVVTPISTQLPKT